MKIWIIYDSKFGNNKRIAEALGDQFHNGNHVEIHYAKDISPKKVAEEEIDLLMFGGPPRAGHIAFTIKSWVKKMAKNLTKQQKKVPKVAVWGSHSTTTPDTPPKFSWDAIKAKWGVLLDNFPAVSKSAEVVAFPVISATLEGPLEPGWEQTVENFAHMVKNL